MTDARAEAAPLFVTVVLDGVGIGAQPDAHRYDDAGSDTLGHVCRAARPSLPHLAALGLGCIAQAAGAPLDGIPAAPEPRAAWGRMQEVSAGKDSTTGHWELAGLRLDDPFPTYPEGFPKELVERFLGATGTPSVLGNVPASGTEIIARLGEQHQQTGHPILYTSADSVFQIAAHEETTGLEELYRLCRIARDEVCVGEHAVGRVIARPFVGAPGRYERIGAHRKDYSRRPTAPTLQEALQAAHVRTVAVGKISDLFAGVGFDEVRKTKSNAQGIEATLEAVQAHTRQHAPPRPTFVWANLVDFDQEFGHRNDPEGFARALEAFDRRLPDLVAALPRGARLLLTADHGNDPTTPSTDHSREYVPLLVYGGPPRPLGTRPSFNDHAATVAAYFDAPFETAGTSFL